jgi:Tol biopolymer transport system component
MKYLIIISLTLLFACDEDNETRPQQIWEPKPVGVIGDGKVSLGWLNGVIFTLLYRPYDFVAPNKFEIYISEDDLSNFTKLAELDNDESYSYTVNNLKNDIPYYFYMTSIKRGFETLVSDTIMIIPNKERKYNELFTQSGNNSTVSAALSNSKDKIAYVNLNHNYEASGTAINKPALTVANLDGSNKKIIDIDSYNPNWSPDDSKIIFRSNKKVLYSDGEFIQNLAYYDYEMDSIKQLINDVDYQIFTPVYSEDGNRILFLSTEDDDNNSNFNVWLMDLKSYEKTKITTLNSGFKDFRWVQWIDNENMIFNAIANNYKYRIFKSPISYFNYEPFFESQWDDFSPSLSPDKSKLAFFSDRSGALEIWIYYIDDKKYKQVTGYEDNFGFYQDWNKINWYDNERIILTINDKTLAMFNVN